MNWIKEMIAKFVFLKITKEATNKMPNIIGKLDGYKTYITAVIGILISLTGAAWGPIDIGGIKVPNIPWSEFWTILWNGLMAIFIRKGIASK